MAGKIIFVPEQPTACQVGYCDDKPDASIYRPGTIWKCDECGRQWVVVEGSQYNEYYKAWRPLTDKNKDGYDRF